MATSNKLAIITGTSTGLGKALLDQYLDEGYFVYHYSRSKIDHPSPNQHHFQTSLTDFEALEASFETILQNAEMNRFTEFVLINNAGRLGESKPIDKQKADSIKETIDLNITALLLMTGNFIARFRNFGKSMVVVNISSGAARSTIKGWSVYSATKAAVDRLSVTIGAELADSLPTARAYSIYPGVVDTPMQAEIREANPSQFPEHQRFVDMKTDGELASPMESARKIRKFAHTLCPATGSILDVRRID